jgi:hypothetical protein
MVRTVGIVGGGLGLGVGRAMCPVQVKAADVKVGAGSGDGIGKGDVYFAYRSVVDRVNELNHADKLVVMKDRLQCVHKYFPMLRGIPITDGEILDELDYIRVLYGTKKITDPEKRINVRNKMIRMMNREGVTEEVVRGLEAVMESMGLLE